jgi:hypothetical protein
MSQEQYSDEFKLWATIVVQGGTTIEKVAKLAEAETERQRVEKTLENKEDAAFRERLRDFCFKAQSGHFSEKPAQEVANDKD